MNPAVRGLVEALRDIGKRGERGACLCGSYSTDPDYVCPGQRARAALAAFAKRTRLDDDRTLVAELSKLLGHKLCGEYCVEAEEQLARIDTAVLGPREPTKEGT